MRWCAWATLLAVALMVAAGPARAERKLAFVAGINAYQNLPREQQLLRAVADAKAVGGALRGMGYAVTELTEDATQEGFLRRFADFRREISQGDTVVFFYAGHGVAFGGSNFLLPSDVPQPSGDDDRLVRSRSIAETDLIDDIRERGARVTVMIIDACRDNPFPKTGTRSLGATRGLAVKEPAEGVFSIYSAGSGQKALDRLNDQTDTDANSVFTRVLLREVARPGLNLIDLGETLRDDVAAMAKSVGHAQVPAVYNQVLGARRVLLGGPAAEAQHSQAPAPHAAEPIRAPYSQQAATAGVQSEDPSGLESSGRENRSAPSAQSPAASNVPTEGREGSLFKDPEAATANQPPSKTVAEARVSKTNLVFKTETDFDIVMRDVRICGSASVELFGGRACATSMLPASSGFSYHPNNLTDGTPTTAWVEGTRGQGVGQRIIIQLPEPREVSRIELMTGYGKNDDIFKKNSRVRSMMIRTSEGDAYDIKLRDMRGWQSAAVPFSGPVEWIELEVAEVYPGSRYEDTAISELRLR